MTAFNALPPRCARISGSLRKLPPRGVLLPLYAELVTTQRRRREHVQVSLAGAAYRHIGDVIAYLSRRPPHLDILAM